MSNTDGDVYMSLLFSGITCLATFAGVIFGYIYLFRPKFISKQEDENKTPKSRQESVAENSRENTTTKTSDGKNTFYYNIKFFP